MLSTCIPFQRLFQVNFPSLILGFLRPLTAEAKLKVTGSGFYGLGVFLPANQHHQSTEVHELTN